ncbi:uncharacterized protein DSM5745_07708 [Aspergillus mulundensis]|uniref:Uncharacterized protein n=1 Tax=Aspergillus mulundensis TaxID=1810919 RepID=A0A3D8REZ5_9EURO|nr:hypothetical protein DSM5745_07708 [Aspergillus mulundensis]RDW72536.1 hypothetical protein DSM5745_07708 [Aspergillus mulundensis]
MVSDYGEFCRDMRERKKRQREENPPPPRRSHDWIIVMGTCHYAKNRSSFRTYERVGKRYYNEADPSGPGTYVAGIGTVFLKLRSSLEKNAPSHEVRLDNVLHIPDALCNGFNYPTYLKKTGRPGGGFMDCGFDQNGDPLWCSRKFRGMFRLVLAGNPQGESYLPEGGSFSVSMHLPLDDIIQEVETRKRNEQYGNADVSEDENWDGSEGSSVQKKVIYAMGPIVPVGTLFQR